MSVSAEFLAEFDLEMAAARRTLERIPEDKLGWKPHEKSMTLGRLAGHIAELPGMGVRVMQSEGFDVANRPAGTKPLVAESRKHVLEIFDKNVADARAAFAGASAEHWAKNWTISAGGEKVLRRAAERGGAPDADESCDPSSGAVGSLLAVE
jgi:uncharacterized damage-inducible protein DinB